MAAKKDTAPPQLPEAVAADPLWQAIAAYEFDPPGVERRFGDRLARENGWPPAYAEAAIGEYRRFCYLAATCGHTVVPSDEVDQVWHLHLLYSERYWDTFCAGVLGRPFHHAPALGGAAEADLHRRMYAGTLASYEAAFGHRPPATLWPPTADRFRHAGAHRRVNAADYVVIPRLDKPKRIGLAICAIGLIVAIWTL
jgi:hypothetical protein